MFFTLERFQECESSWAAHISVKSADGSDGSNLKQGTLFEPHQSSSFGSESDLFTRVGGGGLLSVQLPGLCLPVSADGRARRRALYLHKLNEIQMCIFRDKGIAVSVSFFYISERHQSSKWKWNRPGGVWASRLSRSPSRLLAEVFGESLTDCRSVDASCELLLG